MIRPASFLRDEGGNAITEFALVCPVLLILLFGLSDLAFQVYMQDVLTGAVQKAGRDSTIQNAALNVPAIDNAVESQIRSISPNAQFTPTRESYSNFTQVAPEPFNDTNGNGKLDKGECFTDINGNGVWDLDPGTTGMGSAKDVVYYTMQVKYPRLMPLGSLIGLGDDVTIHASTILMNQPYDKQVTTTPQQICT